MNKLVLGAVVLLLILSGCNSSQTAAPLSPGTTSSPTASATSSPTASPRLSSTPPPYATAFVGVRPVTSTGYLAPGYRIAERITGSCGSGSDIVGHVYRCGSGDGIYDPCWRAIDARTVDCLLEPWSHAVIRMTVPALEKSEDPASSAYDGAPWGLTLRDGRRCIGLQGAHDNFNDRVVDFDCGTSHTVILRGLRRGGTVWRGDSAIYHASSNAYTAGPTLTIATVWWGEPSA